MGEKWTVHQYGLRIADSFAGAASKGGDGPQIEGQLPGGPCPISDGEGLRNWAVMEKSRVCHFRCTIAPVSIRTLRLVSGAIALLGRVARPASAAISNLATTAWL